MLFEKDKIKAVLFDLDDTILNTRDAQANAICDFKGLFSEFNSISKEKFREEWDKITEKCYEEYLNNEYSFKRLRIQRMKKLFLKYGTSISDEEAKNRFKEYLEIYKKNWMLFTDSEEIIKEMKSKYKIAILSNGDSNYQREKIQKVGLNKYFSDIFISGDLGFEKPKKEVFEIASKKINVPIENCVMVGDKYKVDIEGSTNAGMSAIWVNRKKQNINYKYQIKEIVELRKYL